MNTSSLMYLKDKMCNMYNNSAYFSTIDHLHLLHAVFKLSDVEIWMPAYSSPDQYDAFIMLMRPESPYPFVICW